MSDYRFVVIGYLVFNKWKGHFNNNTLSDMMEKILLMVIIAIFALIFTCGGFWCLYVTQKRHSDSYWWAALVCLLTTLTLLSGIAKVANIDIKF